MKTKLYLAFICIISHTTSQVYFCRSWRVTLVREKGKGMLILIKQAGWHHFLGHPSVRVFFLPSSRLLEAPMEKLFSRKLNLKMSHTLCGKWNYYTPTSLIQDLLYVEILWKVRSVSFAEDLFRLHHRFQKMDVREWWT